MKVIEWYPGHMFKSIKEIKEKISLVDLVLILLDARIPFASMNPNIMEITSNKKVILLFNKMDLADKKMLDKWISYYQKQGFWTLKIDSISGKNIEKIYLLAKEVLKEKIKRDSLKGINLKPFRTMILGIPNVGKSTLINRLSNKSVLKTANKPGVTKRSQWVKISENFELLDTPGILWPKFSNDIGLNLAIVGSISDRVLLLEDIAKHLIIFLISNYPGKLIMRYKLINETGEVHELIEKIALTIGALGKEALIDYERVYMTILKDFRNGRFGEITLDKI